MYVPRTTRWAKTPTINRYLYGLILGLVAMSVVSTGSPQASAVVLTEAQAVQLGLSRPDVERLLEGEIDVARSDVLRAKRRPNPTLSYSREDSGGATTKDFFWLTQRVDVSGRKPRSSPKLPVLAVFFSRGTSGSRSFYRFLISSLAENVPRRSV